MQEILELTRALENSSPLPVFIVEEHFLHLRALVAERQKVASREDAALFRDVMRKVYGMPKTVHPEMQVELILDIVRYFYVTGLSYEAFEPNSWAERMARLFGYQHLVVRSLSNAGAFLGDVGNLAGAIEKYSEAIQIAQQTANAELEGTVWSNLGVAFYYLAEYQTAAACSRHAVNLMGAYL